MKYDLHVHTNHSDGIYSPKEVIDLARKINLGGIAITDHDSISAIQLAREYAKEYNDIEIIAGIEFSCVFNEEEVHILGYYIDYRNKDLIKATEKLRDARINRGIKMLRKLQGLGFDIDLADIEKYISDGFIGRPHLARILVEKAYLNNTNEAFERYLKLGAPAYVKRYVISLEDTINLIKSAGGIPILAHPGLIKNRSIYDYCLKKGIRGLEAIHPKHRKEDVTYLIEYAKENKLIYTGGSDFHGDRGKDELLLGKYYVGKNTIMELREMI